MAVPGLFPIFAKSNSNDMETVQQILKNKKSDKELEDFFLNAPRTELYAYKQKMSEAFTRADDMYGMVLDISKEMEDTFGVLNVGSMTVNELIGCMKPIHNEAKAHMALIDLAEKMRRKRDEELPYDPNHHKYTGKKYIRSSMRLMPKEKIELLRQDERLAHPSSFLCCEGAYGNNTITMGVANTLFKSTNGGDTYVFLMFSKMDNSVYLSCSEKTFIPDDLSLELVTDDLQNKVTLELTDHQAVDAVFVESCNNK